MPKCAICGLALTLTLTFAAQAHQPTTVADALTVECLRLDDARTDSATLITQAAARYVGYHPLAQNRVEVRRLYAAYKRYCDGVLERARRKMESAREHIRPRGGSRRA